MAFILESHGFCPICGADARDKIYHDCGDMLDYFVCPNKCGNGFLFTEEYIPLDDQNGIIKWIKTTNETGI